MQSAITVSSQAPVRIMPLGDSITRGISGPSTDDAGYRNDLDSLLTLEALDFDLVGGFADGIGFDNDHAGHDGFRADRLLDVIEDVLSADPPDVILLHIGSNDVSSAQEPEGIRDEIEQIVDIIHSFDQDIKIVLGSLIPRTDAKDEKNNELNSLIQELYQSKRGAGYQVFYAGLNEVFKCNLNWRNDYFDPSDEVHPTDAGFAIMAGVWRNVLMTALSADEMSISDSFQRAELGITWDADPEIEVQEGNLVNTARSGSSRWEYMAVFKAFRTPTRVAVRWSPEADRAGMSSAGLALLLDSPSRNASGLLAWINTSENELRLWTIVGGRAGSSLGLDKPSDLRAPEPGDLFSVTLSGDADSLRFDFFINEAPAGRITADNRGLEGERYAGVLMRHRRNNQIASFLAEGSGDFVAPGAVRDLTVSDVSATSAILSWTAPGDNGVEGRAATYDMRYATSEIATEADFQAATPVARLFGPSNAGTEEVYTELDLLPGTEYYFALRVLDEAGNQSGLSNIVSFTTEQGELARDDFDREELGEDWQVDSSLLLSQQELINLSNDQNTWNLAVFTRKANPTEVSLRWGANVDSVGIDQSGLAVLLDSPDTTANGYLITRRTLRNEIRLWKIIQGNSPIEPIIEIPLLGKPRPGQELRVHISTDSLGNHFTVFVNGRQDITITDPDFFIDPGASEEFYAGLMLAGGRNNHIDSFKVLNGGVPVSVDERPTQEIPQFFTLSQNYPNPFNPETRLDYQLPSHAEVSISVHNLRGQLIRSLFSGPRQPGSYSVTWDGKSDLGLPMASGIYILRLRAGAFVTSRRLTLIK